MNSVRDLVKRAAVGTANVLISGETGVGKAFCAKTIHRLSARPGNFVTVNCAGESADRLETELFGSAGRSDTMGTASKVGAIGALEAASGGTLFLEEVGELPARLQERLLRTIEGRDLEKAGPAIRRSNDVRLIVATSEGLVKKVRLGDFRADLLYRLGELAVCLPPLRQRTQEIPRLVGSLIEDFCVESGRRPSPRIESDAMDRLLGYGWPGNVGELKDVIRRAMWQCDGADISSEHLTVELRPHLEGTVDVQLDHQAAIPVPESNEEDERRRRAAEAIALEPRSWCEPRHRGREVVVSVAWPGSKCSLCNQGATPPGLLLGGPSVFICGDCVAQAQKVSHETFDRRLTDDASPPRGPSLSCSFCGKISHEVSHLVAGAKAVVCDACLDLCDRILADRIAGQWPAGLCDARPFTYVRLIDSLERRPFEAETDLPLITPAEAISRARAARRVLCLVNPWDEVPVFGLRSPGDESSEDDRLVRYGETFALRPIYPVARIEATIAAARDEVVHGNCCRVVVLIDRGTAPAAHALIERVRANLASVANLLEQEPAHRRYALVLVARPSPASTQGQVIDNDGCNAPIAVA